MVQFSAFPNKDDDETVDSDSEELIPPKKKKSSFADKRKNRLTTISSKYDLDGDGILDEAEQAMRDRDVANRGFLTNDEIYDIVQEQLRVKKSAGYMKRLIAGLICFVCLLACSNLATSWASATLAKDLKSDDDKNDETQTTNVPAMKIASTGEIAAAQTVGDTYEATEMTDEQLDYRRRLVLSEIEEDPHSHAHRKLARKEPKCHVMDKSGCGQGRAQRITFDSDAIPADQFSIIQENCASQRTINIKRSWGDGGDRNSRNHCICSRGTSIVVKEKKKKRSGGGNTKQKDDNKGKKKKEKGNGKKKGDKDKVKNKEFIFEQEDGKMWHADCDDDLCYLGGTTFQGDFGDDCLLNADQCRSGLVCERSSNKALRNNKSSRYGTCVKVVKTSTLIVKYAKRGGYCNYNYGWDACGDGLYCEPEDIGEYWTGFNAITTRSSSGGRYGHNYGDCSNDRGSCARGYDCVKSPLNGSDRWDCMANDDAVDFTIGRRSATTVTVTKYRGDGVGTCAKIVGVGQTCFDNYWCGNGNVCDGGVCVRQMRSASTVVVQQNQGRPLYGNEDCTNNRNGCAAGYDCLPSTFNGSDRWLCT